MLVLNFYQILRLLTENLLKQEFGIHLYTDPSLFVGININNIIVAEFMIIISVIRNVSRVLYTPRPGHMHFVVKKMCSFLTFCCSATLTSFNVFIVNKVQETSPRLYMCM